MLLPSKHVNLAESLLGLGGYLLDQLREPKSVDQLYEIVRRARETQQLPAYHDLDSVVLALVLLYSLNAIEANSDGDVVRCA